MCLLVVLSRLDAGAPLVVAANRDERLDRPATAATVLRAGAPRIVGGRDIEAGGTWLAVNEHGVVAGLTNRPSPEGRDLTKWSRGELPVALAAHRHAASAAENFVARFSPADYNPAWILVGDRAALFAIDMTTGPSAVVEELGPGVHILENNALGAPSPKGDNVRALLGSVERAHHIGGGDELVRRLCTVLSDHSVPTAVPAGSALEGRPELESGDADGARQRPVATLAACVHTDDYGTRSSTVISVPAGGGLPGVLVADGHPCTSPFEDVAYLWSAQAGENPGA